MALPLYALKTLAPHLRDAAILCLGHPDVLATPAEVEELFHVKPTREADNGIHHSIVDRKLVDTQEFFSLLGSSLDCVDVYAFRGTERIVDLNYPAALGAYDLVIDPGTTEHCFSIGQAMLNAANAVKVGGRIYHSPPMTMPNHGFYNVCPTMLWDFYTQNGWRIETYEAHSGKHAVKIGFEQAVSRNIKIGNEVSIICVAQRLTDAALKFPTQSKYLAMQAQQEKAA
jgi:hypothetical protein